MNLAGVQRLTFSLLAAPRLYSHTTRLLTARPASLHLVSLPVRGTQTGWSVSGQRRTSRTTKGILTRAVPDPTSTALPERSQDLAALRPRIYLSIPHLAWLLALIVLTGPTGCGPAPSDEAAHVGPHANVGGTPPIGTGSRDAGACPHLECGASPHGRGAGPLAQGLAQPDQRLSASPSSLAPGTEPEHLVLPQWIAFRSA